MDLADQLRRYLLWRDTGYLSSNGRCFDIGNATSSQLARFARTGEPIDPRPDEEAAANGSLMRLAAVPIRWHDDVAEAAERAAESSRTTHPATRPVDACRVLGAMTAALIAGTSAEEVLSPDFWHLGDASPPDRSGCTRLVAEQGATCHSRDRVLRRRARGRDLGRRRCRQTSATPFFVPPTSATTQTRPPPSPVSSPAPAGVHPGSRTGGGARS